MKEKIINYKINTESQWDRLKKTLDFSTCEKKK